MPTWYLAGTERYRGPVPATVVTGYQGPGDIVSGAMGWWGLRAYNANAANTGMAAVRLVDSALSNATDIHLLSTGSLDLTPIPFGSGAPYAVEKLYDQTGSGRDLLGSSRRPGFFLTGNGLTVPSMGFVNASGLFLDIGATTFSISGFPFTFNVVYRHNTSAAAQSLLAAASTSLNVATTAAQSAYMSNGTGFPQASAADAAWHTAQAIFTNTTGDTMNVDNSHINDITSGANAGANLPTSTNLYLGSDATADHLEGFIAEAGIWPSGFTSPQQTAIYNNQHTYYGVF